MEEYRMKTKMKKKAFTLVELLVVIAILAILATVSVVGYTTFIGRAKDSNAETELKQIGTVINGALVVDGVYELGTTTGDPARTYCIVDADKTAATTDSGYVLCTADKDDVTQKLSDFVVVDTAKKFALTAADGVTALDFADDEIALDGVLEFTIDGKIKYTTAAGGTATWDINKNSLVD